MDGMSCSINSYVWSEKHIFPDGDLSYIQHNTACICIKVFSQCDMAAVFAVKRRLKIHTFAMYHTCFIQTFHALLRFKRHYLVVLSDKPLCYHLFRHYAFV